MMQLQTKIPLIPNRNPIDYDSELLLLGSCFVENIGAKLDYFKFKTVQNPFGVIFHPKAIEQLVLRAINKEEYTEDDIFFYNERWHCFEAHSELSSNSKEELLTKLNSSLEGIHHSLYTASHLIFTLGTAWVYRHIASDRFVANCHKVPQKKFLKELFTVEESVASLEAIIVLIKGINPNAKLVFTVSPVRHIKDGFVENQQSKAHLITAIHQVVAEQQNISYFPAYEIMMDELRDYRFYAEDMIHPNTTAINYIWERFSEVWIAQESKKTIKEVAAIQNGLAHRPFNEKSAAHQQFLEGLKDKIKKIRTEYPFMEF